jgi:hypothetical protein
MFWLHIGDSLGIFYVNCPMHILNMAGGPPTDFFSFDPYVIYWLIPSFLV